VKRGLDTNVLVYTHMPSLKDHERVRTYLSSQLNQSDTILVVTPSILHEFVHVVTDGKRFEPPVAMSEALAIARLYLRRTNVECLAMTEESLFYALELLERYNLGRKRIADTLLVATLHQNNVSELITCNPRDFEVFEDLKVIDPMRSEPGAGL
jgi:predicted nucleic acid-binding protein